MDEQEKPKTWMIDLVSGHVTLATTFLKNKFNAKKRCQADSSGILFIYCKRTTLTAGV